eukprot:TRINITY_DN102999_c0_g1_i1.p2 TRINITY_DN102999_c0_g1~~TRINITY_DN102999_c0_g1_i1.p2  ORF type:complete len:137 (-),score=6.42 TRINITY_DN102999_c0_g1_i1:182-592(-)
MEAARINNAGFLTTGEVLKPTNAVPASPAALAAAKSARSSSVSPGRSKKETLECTNRTAAAAKPEPNQLNHKYRTPHTRLIHQPQPHKLAICFVNSKKFLVDNIMLGSIKVSCLPKLNMSRKGSARRALNCVGRLV